MSISGSFNAWQQDTHADTGLELGVSAGEVLAALDRLGHAAVDRLPVGAAEHGAGAEERERVVLGARVVHGDVPEHVLADLLREVDVDTQEVGWGELVSKMDSNTTVANTHDQPGQPRPPGGVSGTSRTKGRHGRPRRTPHA